MCTNFRYKKAKRTIADDRNSLFGEQICDLLGSESHGSWCNVTAADTADVTDDADSDLDMPDDLLDPSDDEDRKRDASSTATADDKVFMNTTMYFIVVFTNRTHLLIFIDLFIYLSTTEGPYGILHCQ